jgi:hypothetical protein
MGVRNCQVVSSASASVSVFAAVVAAAALAVAACGARPAAGQAPPNGSGSASSVRPGRVVTVTLSPRPQPGSFARRSAPSGHRRITPGSSGQVTVTVSDSGATVVLKPGQVITVVLAGQGVLMWDRPRLSAPVPGVLRQLSASGGYPARAPARASYRAVRAGRAQIISSTDARCLHAHPACAIAQRLWQVTVIVSGR